jgi:hypothetical protein
MIMIEVEGDTRLCVLAEASLELPIIGVPGKDAEPEFGALCAPNSAPRKSSPLAISEKLS